VSECEAFGSQRAEMLKGGRRPPPGVSIDSADSLRAACDPSNPKDEDHAWNAIGIENSIDTWVRQVVFKHFAGSAVAVYATSTRATIEDCISQQPVSEIGGERRNTFYTEGQQILFQRCYGENGMHDLVRAFVHPVLMRLFNAILNSLMDLAGDWIVGPLEFYLMWLQ